jgi:hypothetical protein
MKDQRKVLTAMEVNMGVMIEQNKEQVKLNEESRRFTRELYDFKADVHRRLSAVESRDLDGERQQAGKRDEARFRLTLVGVLFGGGLIQAILSHFWK